MSLLATLSMVGCVGTPGYYSRVSQPRVSYGYNSAVVNDPCAPCDPCGPEIDCGTIEYSSNFCAPRCKIVDCRTSLSHLSNGVLLVGRGVLDITAAPFIAVGNLLSSGCQYEVIAHCPGGYSRAPIVRTTKPCSAVGTSGCGTSGCDSCDDGYSEGIQYEIHPQSIQTYSRVLSPPVQQYNRSNSVIQTSYRELSTPGVRFTQPR